MSSEPETGTLPVTDDAPELGQETLHERMDNSHPGDRVTVTYRSTRPRATQPIKKMGLVTEVRRMAGAAWVVKCMTGHGKYFEVRDDGTVFSVGDQFHSRPLSAALLDYELRAGDRP